MNSTIAVEPVISEEDCGLFHNGREIEEKRDMSRHDAFSNDGQELTLAQWRDECYLGEQELVSGQVKRARQRFEVLLEQVEACSVGTPAGRGSYEHSVTLYWLARCAHEIGNTLEEVEWLLIALELLEKLLDNNPSSQQQIQRQRTILHEIGARLQH